MPIPILAQGVLSGSYGIVQLLIALIVLGGIYYIFINVVTLPPKVMLVLNVIIGVVAAVIAIKFLAGFLL